jgi:ankyrin repeat protein
MKAMKLAVAAMALGATAPAFSQAGMGEVGAAFETAIRSGDTDKAVQLIRDNPNIVEYRNGKGETPLMVAIQNRDSSWTGFLLSQNADPNVADRDGNTPLIQASRLGLETPVEWLIQAGARIDEKNRMGETALIVAVQRRQVPIVKMLLAEGADPDLADAAAGYSARDYAKRDGRNPEILKLIDRAHKKPAVGPGR